MGRFSRSWALVKASWSVLRSDRELIIFPIASLIACLLAMATFFIPMIMTGAFDEGKISPIGYVVLFLFYVVTAFITFFCNTALVGAAMIRLRGGDPTVADGWRIASSRVPQILGYSLISATVGMALKALEERLGVVGQFIIRLIGLAWNVATFLVVPILAVEGIGPVDAVKRSSQLLRKTWGEQIIGNGGMGLAIGFISFGVIILGIILVALGIASGMVAVAILAGVLMVVGLIVVGVIGSALSSIYTAALYTYATNGETSAFAPEIIHGAFRAK